MEEMSHVGVLEIEERYGRALTIEKVVLFNQKKLSEEEAMKVVRAGEYSPYVLMMPKAQYLGLFCNQEPPSGPVFV